MKYRVFDPSRIVEKTFKEHKDEVSKEKGYEDFQYVWLYNTIALDVILTEAAERYAKQAYNAGYEKGVDDAMS